jgi:hypothetical protein
MPFEHLLARIFAPEHFIGYFLSTKNGGID